VAIVYRLADNQDDRLPELAADLARHRIAVIATPAVGRIARPLAFQIWQLPRRL
jgi:putative ABC transport system substrate-binding protein